MFKHGERSPHVVLGLEATTYPAVIFLPTQRSISAADIVTSTERDCVNTKRQAHQMVLALEPEWNW